MQCTLNSTSDRISGQGGLFLCNVWPVTFKKFYSFPSTRSDNWGWVRVCKVQVILCASRKCVYQGWKSAHYNQQVWAPSTGLNVSKVCFWMFQWIKLVLCQHEGGLCPCLRWFQAHSRLAFLACWINVGNIVTLKYIWGMKVYVLTEEDSLFGHLVC